MNGVMSRVTARRSFWAFSTVFALVASSSCGDLLHIDDIEFQEPDCADASACDETNGGRQPGTASDSPDDNAGTGGHGGSAAAGRGNEPGHGGTASAGQGSEPEPGGAPAQGGGSGEGGSASVGVECRRHLDCNPQIVNEDPSSISDDPYLCIDSHCVRMRNDDPEHPSGCLKVLGREHLASGAEPFVFGAFARIFPGQSQPSGVTRNYELAVREFASKGGVTIAGKTRVPMAVVCEGISVNREYLARTFDHLVNTLHVPAVITLLEPPDLKWSFEYVHQDWKKSVLFVSAVESESSLLALEDRGLLWHLLGSPADIAPVYVPLVERVEAFLRKKAGISKPIRLALVDSQASFDADVGSILHDRLRFNGKSASENGDEYYLRLRIPGEEHFEEIIDEHLPKLQRFVPDVVVFTGGHEANLMMSFMENWQLPPETPRARPFYVVAPGQNDGPYGDLSVAVSHFDLYERIAGVNYAAAEDDTLYKAYLSTLEATFPMDGLLGGRENYYDAAYYLIYSAVAAQSEWPLDGAAMAVGLRRLLDGPAYAVGGLNIPATAAALRVEPTIALQGTLGPAAFDPKTGGWRGNASVFCIEQREGTDEFSMDVLKYDRGTGELKGEFPCIDGF